MHVLATAELCLPSTKAFSVSHTAPSFKEAGGGQEAQKRHSWNNRFQLIRDNPCRVTVCFVLELGGLLLK